jgi:Ca2+-binding RTX toxin-like protein
VAGRINGNELDNTFLGGDLNDQFEGRGGDDRIEGDLGVDEAFFSGPSTDYTIVPLDATVTRVTDTVPGRDGVDDVRQITRLHFSDVTIDL